MSIKIAIYLENRDEGDDGKPLDANIQYGSGECKISSNASKVSVVVEEEKKEGSQKENAHKSGQLSGQIADDLVEAEREQEIKHSGNHGEPIDKEKKIGALKQFLKSCKEHGIKIAAKAAKEETLEYLKGAAKVFKKLLLGD